MDWIHDLMDLARCSPHYQNCLQDVQDTEPAFLAIRESLTPEQQEQLDAYLSACEELEHCLTLLAYQLHRNAEEMDV